MSVTKQMVRATASQLEAEAAAAEAAASKVASRSRPLSCWRSTAEEEAFNIVCFTMHCDYLHSGFDFW